MLYYLTYIVVQELFGEIQLYWRQFWGNSGNSGNSGKSGKQWCVILALFCVISAFSATVRRYFSVILRYFEFLGFSGNSESIPLAFWEFSGNSEIAGDPSLWPMAPAASKAPGSVATAAKSRAGPLETQLNIYC